MKKLDAEKKEDLLKEALKKFEHMADVDEDSDLPITEKKSKNKNVLD